MSLDSIGITNLMNKNIIVAEQNLNLIGVSRIMSNNNIGCVVIVDDLEYPKASLELLPKEISLEQLVCYNHIRW